MAALRALVSLHIEAKGRMGGGWGAESERWSGSRAFGEKCSHSIAVRGHPGKSRLVETRKGALMTRTLI